jgi:predicted nucleotidyltransferase
MDSNPAIHNDILAAIKSASKYKSIRKIGIFGSYARGDWGAASDLDLLYDYDETADDSADEILEYVETVDAAAKNTANMEKVDFVWYKGMIESANAKFKEAVLRDVIWIYEA